MTLFELAVQDPTGVRAAREVGADRLELCSGLALGGVTPSRGLIEDAVAGGVPVHVLVRPRAGGFAYDADERAVILRDAADAVDRGAHGVVVGGVVDDAVDLALVRAVIEVIPPGRVSFHRAFDTVGDRLRALEELVEAGVTRILTSGGAASASDALGELRTLVARADGRIEIMAGGGVTAANAAEVAATGVDAVHASAKRAVAAAGISLGSAGDIAHETTDVGAARLIAAVLRGEVAS